MHARLVSPLAAEHVFHSALRRAHRARWWGRLRRRGGTLDALDEALLRDGGGRPAVRRPLGLREVALREVVGSVGRARDYAPNFAPLREHDRDRWLRVLRALHGSGLPPLRLLRWNGRLYVEDGHHRVSVMRHLGIERAEAYLTELHPPSETPASWVAPHPEPRPEPRLEPRPEPRLDPRPPPRPRPPAPCGA